MFRSVAKIEQRMQNYGVNALRRLRTAPAAPTTNSDSTDQQEARGFVLKLKQVVKYLCQANHRFAMWCFRFPCAGNVGCYDPERPSRETKSNKMASQKRAVLQMAFGYAGAWLLVWAPFFAAIVFLIVTLSVPPDFMLIMVTSTAPLQGFFNFIVFMAPKVRTKRMMAMRRRGAGANTSSDNNNQKQQLTWFQAFNKAYMDRGGRIGDTRNLRNNNRAERRIATAALRKISDPFRILFERMKSFTRSSSIRTHWSLLWW
jgi:hypothetical protein